MWQQCCDPHLVDGCDLGAGSIRTPLGPFGAGDAFVRVAGTAEASGADEERRHLRPRD